MKLIRKLMENGSLILKVGHSEKIMMGGYESINPSIEIGFIYTGGELDEAIFKQAKAELLQEAERLFVTNTLNHIRGVFNRRRSQLTTSDDMERAVEVANHYKQLYTSMQEQPER